MFLWSKNLSILSIQRNCCDTVKKERKKKKRFIPTCWVKSYYFSFLLTSLVLHHSNGEIPSYYSLGFSHFQRRWFLALNRLILLFGDLDNRSREQRRTIDFSLEIIIKLIETEFIFFFLLHCEQWNTHTHTQNRESDLESC